MLLSLLVAMLLAAPAAAAERSASDGLVAVLVDAHEDGPAAETDRTAPATRTSPKERTPLPEPRRTPTATPTTKRRGFYGTVTAFTPASTGMPGSLSAQALEPASSGAGLTTFDVTDHTLFRDGPPQVGDGVAIVWEGRPSQHPVAAVVYVRPGGLPDGDQPWQPRPSGSEPNKPSKASDAAAVSSPTPTATPTSASPAGDDDETATANLTPAGDPVARDRQE